MWAFPESVLLSLSTRTDLARLLEAVVPAQWTQTPLMFLPASAVFRNCSTTSVNDEAPPSCTSAICTGEHPIIMFTHDLSSTVTRRCACNQQVPVRLCKFRRETPQSGVAVLAVESSNNQPNRNNICPIFFQLETLAIGNNTLDSNIVEPILYISPTESRLSRCTLLYPRCSIENPLTENSSGAAPSTVTAGAQRKTTC